MYFDWQVRREWRSLVTQTDSLMEVSLRQAVKRSLQELSRAINGDAKTEPQTVSVTHVSMFHFRRQRLNFSLGTFALAALYNMWLVFTSGG